MQTKVMGPTTGIEMIDPSEAVIEKPGAKTARIENMVPIAPIHTVSRAKLVSDFSDHTEPQRQDGQSAIARSSGPNGTEALIGDRSGRSANAGSTEEHCNMPKNVNRELGVAISEMSDGPKHTGAVHIKADPEQYGCRKPYTRKATNPTASSATFRGLHKRWPPRQHIQR